MIKERMTILNDYKNYFLKKITFLGRTLLSNRVEAALCDHFGIKISVNIVCVITYGTYQSVN